MFFCNCWRTINSKVSVVVRKPNSLNEDNYLKYTSVLPYTNLFLLCQDLMISKSEFEEV